MVSASQPHAPDTCGPFAYPSPAEKELPRDLLNTQRAFNTEPRQKKKEEEGIGEGQKYQ